jgi:hypothetical protein
MEPVSPPTLAETRHCPSRRGREDPAEGVVGGFGSLCGLRDALRPKGLLFRSFQLKVRTG